MFGHIPRGSSLFLALLFITVLASCSGGSSGTGVLLWSPDDQKMATGSLVRVVSDSAIRGTSSIVAEDPSGKTSGAPMDVEQWRVMRFHSFGDAKSYLNKNKDTLREFGRSTRQALPIRKDSNQLSDILYRLRLGEDVKILEKQGSVVDVGGLQGSWYRVISEKGTIGWVFNQEISLYQYGTDSPSTQPQSDDLVSTLSTAIWRPEAFQAMIQYGEFDLSQFRPDAGFFLDSQAKVIHVISGTDKMDFNFSALDKVDNMTYRAHGTSLQITFRDPDSLVAQFENSGAMKSLVFVKMSQDIASMVQAELARRTKLLGDFSGPNDSMHSSNYGIITVSPNGNFTWKNPGPLVPALIPQDADGTGSLDFGLYLGKNIRDQYRGVVTFTFNRPNGKTGVNFLYQIMPDGVQLSSAASSQIDGMEISRADINASVLFFAY